MKKMMFTLAIAVSVFTAPALSQQSVPQNRFRVLCYNVENLFDIVDDSLTRDEEYLPGGMRGWNYSRYQRKLIHIGRVLVGGGWDSPAVVGLCEIESRKALLDLTMYSPLKNLAYKFVHYESPDARGVDVALLYQPEFFKTLHHYPIRISYPHAPDSRTRDILYVAGKVPTGDTLHCFVCHFPSRLGGELESEQNRIFVASVVRNKVDSIVAQNKTAKILIMGDFNDYPDNQSMLNVLQAKEYGQSDSQLFNLMFPLHKKGIGTHKHAGEWGALDQLIVSKALLEELSYFRTQPDGARILDLPFLLTEDKQYLGMQPFRTYAGMKYLGGYSDHLPVYIDFFY